MTDIIWYVAPPAPSNIAPFWLGLVLSGDAAGIERRRYLGSWPIDEHLDVPKKASAQDQLASGAAEIESDSGNDEAVHSAPRRVGNPDHNLKLTQ